MDTARHAVFKCADKQGPGDSSEARGRSPESSALREMLAFGREGPQVAMGNTCAGVSGRAACVGRGKRDRTTAPKRKEKSRGRYKSSWNVCCILAVYCCEVED